MDELQFGTLIMALNRIGDALEQANMLALAARPAAPAPKLWRPLQAYAAFDWATIGATVMGEDVHGATEVEWNGRVFTRRRSAEDDDKGEDIRFSRVASGTVAEKNIVWEVLIKFGGNRKPAKPLRGDLADKVAQAKTALPKPPAPPTQPDAPPGPTYEQLLSATREMLSEHAAQFIKASTAATNQQAADVKAALVKHAGDEARVRRVLSALFDRELVNRGQALALFEWLKPAPGTDGIYAANRDARDVVKQIAEMTEKAVPA